MNDSDIAHRRLRNQGLSKILFKDAHDAVSQLGAVQAQDFAGAKWALGQRLKDSTESALDQAFADGSILRTHLMRPTWHFVTPEDIRWLLKLTAPRVHAISAFMVRQVELNKTIIRKSYKLLEKALAGNKHLTRTELGSIFEKAGIPAKGVRLAYFMMSAELDGIICSGPRKGKQFTYALLEERVHQVKAISREEALAELVKRYFSTRGPATLQDFTWWSGLTMADARNGIEMVKSKLRREELDDQMYWFAETDALQKEKTTTAYLLPNYDEYIVGYTDRSQIYNSLHTQKLDSRGNVLFQNTLVIDGQVTGTWKHTLKKSEVIIELTSFTKRTKAEGRAIANAVERYGRFLELPVAFTQQESLNEQRKTRSF
jgi:hypothetical protein